MITVLPTKVDQSGSRETVGSEARNEPNDKKLVRLLYDATRKIRLRARHYPNEILHSSVLHPAAGLRSTRKWISIGEADEVVSSGRLNGEIGWAPCLSAIFTSGDNLKLHLAAITFGIINPRWIRIFRRKNARLKILQQSLIESFPRKSVASNNGRCLQIRLRI